MVPKNFFASWRREEYQIQNYLNRHRQRTIIIMTTHEVFVSDIGSFHPEFDEFVQAEMTETDQKYRAHQELEKDAVCTQTINIINISWNEHSINRNFDLISNLSTNGYFSRQNLKMTQRLTFVVFSQSKAISTTA